MEDRAVVFERKSSGDRAEVFYTEFYRFWEYFSDMDEVLQDWDWSDLEIKAKKNFVDKMFSNMNELMEELSFAVLKNTIALVERELEKHTILSPLLELRALLQRALQYERDYHANKKIDKQKRIEQQEKEYAERQKRRLKDKGLMTPSPDPQGQDDASDASDASDSMPRAKRAKETPLKDPVVEYMSD